MRRIALAIMVIFLGSGSLLADDLYIEYEVQRWGADYSTFEVSTARGCGEECARDPDCLAWTWSRPFAEGPNGVCHLKADVPFWSHNPCCESGVAVGTGEGARPRSAARPVLPDEAQTAEVSRAD